MNKKQLLSFLIISLSLFIIASCVKKKFDDPPEQLSYDPGLKVTHSIWDLKSMYYQKQAHVITEDVTIAGIVIADDRAGSFYKQIVIQDSTSGIAVLLNRSGTLYVDFPVGRKVYIRCKGLYLGAYGGFIQLGGGYDQLGASIYEIPANMIDKYVVKATYPNKIEPIKVKISQIKFTNTNQSEQQRRWLGRLIEIDSTEFVATEVGQPYAQDGSIASGTDRNIQDCSGDEIIVRNSGYSQFRFLPLPSKNGKLTAVYSTYESSSKKTPQLLLRDTNDVKYYNPRCGGVIIGPPTFITIDSLRKLYIGTDTSQTIIIPPGTKIKGVVTSSISPDSNISKYNVMFQDESGKAIVVYYPGSGASYKMGDSLNIDISGEDLLVYRGTLEVTSGAAKTTWIAGNKTVVPIPATIAQINSDLNNPVFSARQYESVLMKVSNCTISGTPVTYSGEKTLNDGTASIVLFTRFNASFAGTTFPTTPVSVTGQATKYFSKNEIVLRKASDVEN